MYEYIHLNRLAVYIVTFSGSPLLPDLVGLSTYGGLYSGLYISFLQCKPGGENFNCNFTLVHVIYSHVKMQANKGRKKVIALKLKDIKQ